MDVIRIRLTMHQGKPARCVRCDELSMRFVAFMTAGGVLVGVFVYCDTCDDLSR